MPDEFDWQKAMSNRPPKRRKTGDADKVDDNEESENEDENEKENENEDEDEDEDEDIPSVLDIDWGPCPEERRNEILFKVLMGDCSREDAERLAENERLGPFASVPPVAGIEALGNLWSPEMVAIWITSKDVEAVSRHNERHCVSSAVWVANIPGRYHDGAIKLLSMFRPDLMFKTCEELYRGSSLLPLKPTRLFSSYYDFTGELCEFPEIQSWYPKLREALVSGRIHAWGTPSKNEPGRMITADEWRFASFTKEDVGSRTLVVGREQVYDDVAFIAQEILTEFPGELVRYRPWQTAVISVEELSLNRRLIVEAMQRSGQFALGFPINQVKKARNDRIWRCVDDQDFRRRYTISSDTKFYNLVQQTYRAYFGEDEP